MCIYLVIYTFTGKYTSMHMSSARRKSGSRVIQDGRESETHSIVYDSIIYVYVCIYIYIYREREIERERDIIGGLHYSIIVL